jgi:hypothetical protein
MDRRLLRRISNYLDRQSRSNVARVRALDREEWFDLWHLHPDWKCRAGRSPELADRATLSLLRVAVDHFAGREHPLEIFATLCRDVGDNAVYLHSPNPNGVTFPHMFPAATWLSEVPADRFPQGLVQGFEAARVEYNDGPVWIVRPIAQ